MRKPKELLPIARQFLITKDSDCYRRDREAYTCLAATMASDHGLMSPAEERVLTFRIMDEIHQVNRHLGTLIGMLQVAGLIPDNLTARHDDYFPHRDAWLDQLQLKLEQED